MKECKAFRTARANMVFFNSFLNTKIIIFFFSNLKKQFELPLLSCHAGLSGNAEIVTRKKRRGSPDRDDDDDETTCKTAMLARGERKKRREGRGGERRWEEGKGQIRGREWLS